MKTLVCVIGETRAEDITFDNFKKNVLDELGADLCLAVGIKSSYNYDNPYYKNAKYTFTYQEPSNYENLLEEAYQNIVRENNYDLDYYYPMKDINTFYGKIYYPSQCTDNLTHMGTIPDFDEKKHIVKDPNVSEYVYIGDTYGQNDWKHQFYKLKTSTYEFFKQDTITTYIKPFHWKKFLNFKFNVLGGLDTTPDAQPGSGAINLFVKHFLLTKLRENKLLEQYDRFIITRSDYNFVLPHPRLELLDEDCIWTPQICNYGGINNRHTILGKKNVEKYLNIFERMTLDSTTFYRNMFLRYDDMWNPEKLLKTHLEINGLINTVKYIPSFMYLVRTKQDNTRWSIGIFFKELGYFVKYMSEYTESQDNKKEYEESKHQLISVFYINKLNKLNTN